MYKRQIPGCVGETSTLAILIGAAILLFTGVASWRTMSFVFIGGLAMGYFFQALGVTTYQMCIRDRNGASDAAYSPLLT